MHNKCIQSIILFLGHFSVIINIVKSQVLIVRSFGSCSVYL